MTCLTQFASRYVAARPLSPEYAANLKRRAAFLEIHSGQSDLEQVLTEPTVNAFLASLVGSPYTIRSYRSDILSLWNGAADLDLVPYPVGRRIAMPELPDLLIECYSEGEARSILAAAEKLAGCYRNGVARRDYWQAAVRLAWDSGLRRGDVWRLRRDSVREGGLLRVIQHKTKKQATARLRPSTLAALDKIGLPQPCQWTMDSSYFGRHFKRLVLASGVNRGTFKFLRRSSGSYVELQQPGAGAKHLGHTDARVFDRHYNAKLGEHSLPMPPEL